MSCLYIPKKFKELPSSSKKAWNSFTSTLYPKLRHLTKTTTHRLLDLRHNKRHRRTSSSSRDTFYYHKQYNNYHHLQQPRTPNSGEPNSSASVYVDRLFEESCSSTPNKVDSKVNKEPSATSSGGMTTKDGGRKKKKKVRHSNSNSNSNSNNSNKEWKEYVASMPNIRGVDERAEEFISKFRQDMQIQREQSLIEFHEMLARSA